MSLTGMFSKVRVLFIPSKPLAVKVRSTTRSSKLLLPAMDIIFSSPTPGAILA